VRRFWSRIPAQNSQGWIPHHRLHSPPSPELEKKGAISRSKLGGCLGIHQGIHRGLELQLCGAPPLKVRRLRVVRINGEVKRLGEEREKKEGGDREERESESGR
jgi:hypothetical protein